MGFVLDKRQPHVSKSKSTLQISVILSGGFYLGKRKEKESDKKIGEKTCYISHVEFAK